MDFPFSLTMLQLINVLLASLLFLIDQHSRLFDPGNDQSVLLADSIGNLWAVLSVALIAAAVGALAPDPQLNYLAKVRKLFPIMLMVTLAILCVFVLSMG